MALNFCSSIQGIFKRRRKLLVRVKFRCECHAQIWTLLLHPLPFELDDWSGSVGVIFEWVARSIQLKTSAWMKCSHTGRKFIDTEISFILLLRKSSYESDIKYLSTKPLNLKSAFPPTQIWSINSTKARFNFIMQTGINTLY